MSVKSSVHSMGYERTAYIYMYILVVIFKCRRQLNTAKTAPMPMFMTMAIKVRENCFDFCKIKCLTNMKKKH